MKSRPKHILPVIVAMCLAALLVLWVRYEMNRQRAAAYDYLRSNAHTVLTAMRGTIQAEMQRGAMRRMRLKTIMEGILDETDIRYLALMRNDDELVAVGTPGDLPRMTESVGDVLDIGQMVCWCPVTADCQMNDDDDDDDDSGKGLGHLKHSNLRGMGNGMGKGWKKTPDMDKTEDDEDEVPVPLTVSSGDDIQFTQDQRFVIAFDDAGYRYQIAAAKQHLVIISVVAGLAILGLTVVWIVSARGQDLKSELQLARERDDQFKEFELAAFGLAHETRHPLGVIRASAKQIADSDGLDAESRRRALDIVEEADVATSRMGEFMNYARMKTPSLEVFDGKELLDNLAELLKDDFSGATMGFEVEASPLSLRADRDMFQRLVLNVVMNGLQACSEGDTVKVCLGPHGDGARLTVSDTGPGIPEEIRDKVFQPYVTGRPDGHGIGLAVVRKIALEHEWQLDLKTRAGEGTSISVSGIECSGETT